MRVENNNVSGQNHDPEQIDLIDLLVQLWRGKMTIIISVIVAIALAIGYLAVAKEKWTSTAIITQPDVGQIAGYNNAMNVIYGQAAPKVSDLQETLIGRFSSAFSALAETNCVRFYFFVINTTRFPEYCKCQQKSPSASAVS